MTTRRQFLKAVIMSAGGTVPILRRVAAMGDASLFKFALLRHNGGWNSRPFTPQRILSEIDLRTSIKVAFEPVPVAPMRDELFDHPFLWMNGNRAFDSFSEKSVKHLRRFLRFGGTIFADDGSGKENSPFKASLTRELKRIFPARTLKPLPEEHAVYHSFYYLKEAVGRFEVDPNLEAITVDGRACLIYSPNDLSGALEGKGEGQWTYKLDSGKSSDREKAMRLAINAIMYALTVDYKLDQVHVSYQLRHPSRYPEASPALEDPSESR
ncbi:MAG: DUF4159 domain-containing protein [Candidatus Brocadiia bacterium]